MEHKVTKKKSIESYNNDVLELKLKYLNILSSCILDFVQESS